MEGCSGMYVEVFRNDVLNLWQLLNEKDIKLKVSQHNAREYGYTSFDEPSILHFLCHNFYPCSKAIQNCVKEANVSFLG
jgi:hypothetical protein